MPRNVSFIAALALTLTVTACGNGDDQPDTAALPFGLGKAMECMQVHAAALQAGMGPVAVANASADNAGLIDGMRETARALPLEADMPRVMGELADLLEGVSGKGVDAAKALVDSPEFTRRLGVLTGWHQANCKKDEAA